LLGLKPAHKVPKTPYQSLSKGNGTFHSSPNSLFSFSRNGPSPSSLLKLHTWALLGHNRSTHCFTLTSSPGKLNLNFSPFFPFQCLCSTSGWRWNLMLASLRLFFQFPYTGWSYNTPLFSKDRCAYVLTPLYVREVKVSCL